MSVKVQSYVWEHSKQKGSALLMLLAIADAANDQGEAFPAIPRLAKKTRMSERNAQVVIQKLEVAGEVIVQERENTSNVYIIPVPWRAEPPAPQRKPHPQRGVKGASPGGERGFTGVVKGASPGVVKGVSPYPSTLLPIIDPSLETIVPDGTDARAAFLESVRYALHFNDAPYPLLARYVQFLTARVPEHSAKNKRNGDWYALQPARGMTRQEIVAFGLWLEDAYDGEPLRKPAALVDYVGRFRADDDYGLYLKRAEFAPTDARASPDDEDMTADEDEPDRSVEMDEMMHALAEKFHT